MRTSRNLSERGAKAEFTFADQIVILAGKFFYSLLWGIAGNGISVFAGG
jgi:hypothetical protein